MVEPRANLVRSLRGAPDAQAQICSSAPAARKMSERLTTCRDCTALGAGITPARRPQHSPDGDAYSEDGLAVHAHVWRAPREALGGALHFLEHKIPQMVCPASYRASKDIIVGSAAVLTTGWEAIG